jgi:hypothetical protein
MVRCFACHWPESCLCDQIRKSVAERMTEERARELLGEAIREDGALECGWPYFAARPNDSTVRIVREIYRRSARGYSVLDEEGEVSDRPQLERDRWERALSRAQLAWCLRYLDRCKYRVVGAQLSVGADRAHELVRFAHKQHECQVAASPLLLQYAMALARSGSLDSSL